MGRLKAGLQRHALRVLMPLLRRAPAPVSAVVIEGPRLDQLQARARETARSTSEPSAEGVKRLARTGTTAQKLPDGSPRAWSTGGRRDRLLDGLSDQQALRRFEVEGRDHLDRRLRPEAWGDPARQPLRLAPAPVALALPRGYPSSPLHGTPPPRLHVHDPTVPDRWDRSGRRSCSSRADRRRPRPPRRSFGPCVSSTRGWSCRSPATSDGKGLIPRRRISWARPTSSRRPGSYLAAMTGAPVVPVFCRPDGQGRYLLEFLPSFRFPPKPLATARTRRYVQRASRRGRRAGPPAPRPEQPRLLHLAQARNRPVA